MKSIMKVTPLPLNIYKMCLTWAGRDYFVWESSQAGECVSGGGSPVAIFHTDNIKLAHNNSHPVIDKMNEGTDKYDIVFDFP